MMENLTNIKETFSDSGLGHEDVMSLHMLAIEQAKEK